MGAPGGAIRVTVSAPFVRKRIETRTPLPSGRRPTASTVGAAIDMAGAGATQRSRNECGRVSRRQSAANG